jgi:serine/threonine protein kinase
MHKGGVVTEEVKSPRSFKLRRYTTNTILNSNSTPYLSRKTSEQCVSSSSESKDLINSSHKRDVERLIAIAKGGNGITVWKARIDGWLCCMKELERCNVTPKEESHFKKEIVLYSSIPQDNKHLCRFLGWQQTETHIQVFLTLYDGSLNDVIQTLSEQDGHFTEQEIVDYSIQILGALHVLHNRRLLHRDLKSHNILYQGVRKQNQGGGNLHLILSDFGESILLSPRNKAKTCVGTPRWTAPEVLLSNTNKKEGYSDKIDMWSFGMLLYEMMTLSIPYNTDPHLSIAKKIIFAKLPDFNNVTQQERYSRILPIYYDLLQYDHTKRLSSGQALIRFEELATQLKLKEL